MRRLVVVEADKDLKVLIETVSYLDSRFTVAGVSTTAEDALQMVRDDQAALIIPQAEPRRRHDVRRERRQLAFAVADDDPQSGRLDDQEK